MPDKTKLQLQYKKIYGNEFLRLNNLKVGDCVKMEFDYQKIESIPRSKGKLIKTYKKNTEGVLKLDNDGVLYAESNELMDFYYVSYDFYNRAKYNLQKRKSIIKFGGGFIL